MCTEAWHSPLALAIVLFFNKDFSWQNDANKILLYGLLNVAACFIVLTLSDNSIENVF